MGTFGGGTGRVKQHSLDTLVIVDKLGLPRPPRYTAIAPRYTVIAGSAKGNADATAL